MKLVQLTQRLALVRQLALGVVTDIKLWLAASLPNRCLMCHQSVMLPETGICSVCLSAGIYQHSVCLGCGCSLITQSRYCGSCLRQEPLMIVAPCSYHKGLGPWVAAIKYRAQFAALPVLTKELVNRVQELEHLGLLTLPQVLIPVPLHADRLKQRGFNQAWIITQALSQQLDIPLSTYGLNRVLDTQPQAGLTGKQRRRNLANAFELEQDFPYQRIAIIDDVVTTGTTAKEIASLFEKRHIHVQVWCLARAEAPGLLD